MHVTMLAMIMLPIIFFESAFLFLLFVDNGPEITKALKRVLKDDYNYDSTPTFYALYRSFTESQSS